MTPVETSPGYRDQLRRRTSSFSSHHDRSPVTPRSKHRFSQGSQLSADFGARGADERGDQEGGLGNLADELDQLDDEYDDDDEAVVVDDSHHEALDKEVRDSGIDVSYALQSTTITQRPTSSSSSRPHTSSSSADDNPEDLFSPALEDLLNAVARMTSTTTSSSHAEPDPLIPRAVAAMQDLGNQTALEAATQRLTTSTNSLTAHLTTQTRALQVLAQQTLFSPCFFAAAAMPPPPPSPAATSSPSPTTIKPATASSHPNNPPDNDPAARRDEDDDDDLPALLEALLAALPGPDPGVVARLDRLERETGETREALAQVVDSLQMGKRNAAGAARCLRATQAVVEELRREWAAVEKARGQLEEGKGSGGGSGVQGECRDVLEGFERTCEWLRERLERGGDGGGGKEVKVGG